MKEQEVFYASKLNACKNPLGDVFVLQSRDKPNITNDFLIAEGGGALISFPL